MGVTNKKQKSKLKHVHKMKVLALVDASETSKNALINYLDHQHKPKNELYLFHAKISPPIPVVDCTNFKIAEKEIMQVMAKFNKEEADFEFDMDNLLREHGNVVPKRRIWVQTDSQTKVPEMAVAAADDVGADLILTGSRGLTGIKKHWVGSVSDYVLRNAGCSVLINKK